LFSQLLDLSDAIVGLRICTVRMISGKLEHLVLNQCCANYIIVENKGAATEMSPPSYGWQASVARFDALLDGACLFSFRARSHSTIGIHAALRY
jgi:hypothetical protein